MALVKICAFAERLTIPRLTKHILYRLAEQLAREKETPIAALLYACKRPHVAGTDLLKMLVKFTTLICNREELAEYNKSEPIPSGLLLQIIEFASRWDRFLTRMLDALT